MLTVFADKLKFLLLSYFSRHICPNTFSLTNEEARNNDFFEVHVYVPSVPNNEIEKIPKENYGVLSIKCEFMPESNAARWGDILAGRVKYSNDFEFKDGHLSSEYLRYSRIDVNYYFGHWNIREQHCSLYTLFKLFSLRFGRLVYLIILKHWIEKFIKVKISRRKLRSPIKSKYEIYEALMNSDTVLRQGSFTKSELSTALFGNHYIGEYSIYQKVSKSLDWIIEACIEEGEIKKVEHQEGARYEIKGKGIHYFTLTKEHLKTVDANKRIQEQQISIQKKMVWLTVFLVIGTFLSIVDKTDKIKALWSSISGQLDKLF
jgi:hypothetical protein